MIDREVIRAALWRAMDRIREAEVALDRGDAAAVDEAKTRAMETLAGVWALAPDAPVSSLALSTRTRNALERSGVATVAQLATCSDAELLSIRGLGREGLGDVHDALEAVGFVRRNYGRRT